MKKVVRQSFFGGSTIAVAKKLLGMDLVRKLGGRIIRMPISEVEVYDGPDDKASHAFSGKTHRNLPMFGPPGYIYVYLVYGKYYMLNIITREIGYPAAILIRGAGMYDGPGKLTRGLNISKSINGKLLHPRSGLWIEKNSGVRGGNIKIISLPRVGVSYAGHRWASRKLRFLSRSKVSPYVDRQTKIK